MSNSNSNTFENSMQQQLAERRRRLQQQNRQNQNNQNSQNNQNTDDNGINHSISSLQISDNNDHGNSVNDGMSDWEIARNLQREYDAMARSQSNDNNNNYNNNNNAVQDIQADDDVEMIVNGPVVDNSHNGNIQQQSNGDVIDRDYEIALQLQRQFDNENSNVPAPNTNPQPQPQPSHNHNYNNNQSGSHSHPYFPFTTTGPDGVTRTIHRSGNMPSGMSSSFMMGMGNNSNNDPFAVFNTHPFFTQNRGMSGFNEPFFTQNPMNSYPSNNNQNDTGFHPVNMNFMVNNFPPMQLFHGSGGFDIEALHQMLHPRPPVANQQDIDNQTVTETYHAKSKPVATDNNNNNNNNNKKKKKKDKKKRKVSSPCKGMEELWQANDTLTQKEQELLEKEDIYIVEEIVNHRKIGDKKYEYNIKWKGYADTTWEPKTHINTWSLRDYWAKKGYKIDAEGALEYLKDLPLDEAANNDRKKRKRNSKKGKKEKTPKRTKSKTRDKSKSPKKNKKHSDNDKKHGDNEHDDDKWRCGECDMSFKNGYALNGHKSKHGKKKSVSTEDVQQPYWEDTDEEREILIIPDDDDE